MSLRGGTGGMGCGPSARPLRAAKARLHPLLIERRVFRLLLRGVLVFELAEDFSGGHLRYRAHAVGDERAVQVVELVLPDAREVAGFDLVDVVALHVFGADAHRLVADDAYV